MTLQQLRYVIEIAKAGSINEAARRLFVSQPSLSTSLKDLEEELDFNIFYRMNTGIKLSKEGLEFLGYAKQVVEQTELLENRYFDRKKSYEGLSISSQHYSFVIEAFVNMFKREDLNEYGFNIRETKTYKIIEDVKNGYSELGILYKNSLNRKVISKVLKDNNLSFNFLFEATPHVFMSANHPLANKKSINIDDLRPYPCLSFEQGENNSLYFSEELLNLENHKKNIHVTDRATLFNLLIGIEGFTISTGLLNFDLNGGDGIIAVPIESKEIIEIGWISPQNIKLSNLGDKYLASLKYIIKNSVN